MKHNNYRIIRRRVCSLIGRWTGIKLSPELRPLLYEYIINLLGADEDMAVRLTASSTLRYAIDDFEFNSDQFRDYLDLAFNLLFSLLKEANECETKVSYYFFIFYLGLCSTIHIFCEFILNVLFFRCMY